jgi:hypothetical protein
VSPRAARTRDCSPSEARARADQARAFVDVADLVLGESSQESHVAAALAVLAGIAAGDAICGAKLGRYYRGQDHGQAAQLLRTVDLPGKDPARLLARLLAAKDSVHYSPTMVSPAEAKRLVRLARAIVEAAWDLI